MTRHRTPEAIAALKMDLKQNWTEMYANDDPNKACVAFMTALVQLYEKKKNCPLKKLTRKHKYTGKP